jgi:hypothetical protein
VGTGYGNNSPAGVAVFCKKNNLATEAGGRHHRAFFVTNYWHTVRYPWHDAEQITESKRLGRRVVHLHLRAAGRFGRVISFLPARHYDELMKNFGVSEN